MVCRICRSTRTKVACRGREMMHGLRDEFDYFECSDCGCLQIAEVPAHLEKYYPGYYYSLKLPDRAARLGNDLELLAAAVGLDRVTRWFGSAPPAALPDFIPADLPRRARILDVGAGTGFYLEWLYRSGYRNLHGVDPNLAKGGERSFPFRLERATLDALVARGESYSFVYLSHSLEHMVDQAHALGLVQKLLAPGGTCCVRIPWTSCDAWERYGAEWVQLDAPRHLYLHSKRSFETVVSSAGFRIVKLWCDSTGFQFWGSEQYLRDIPLYSDRSWLVAPERSIFSNEQIEEYERQARELNERGRGDQIVAWLSPIATAS
jgi:SAM-dependent methyltransferase